MKTYNICYERVVQYVIKIEANSLDEALAISENAPSESLEEYSKSEWELRRTIYVKRRMTNV